MPSEKFQTLRSFPEEFISGQEFEFELSTYQHRSLLIKTIIFNLSIK